MKISVFGLGYVGAVTAACLAEDGHEVIGVDPNRIKVDLLNQGRSPVMEEGVPERISNAVAAGRLSATTSADDAIKATDLGFVCVGTPSQTNGKLDLMHLREVAKQIGEALQEREDFFVLVIRSTILPGTTRNVVIPALERASGRRVGRDIGLCVHPEFMREGSAVHDFRHPPKVVISASDEMSRSRLLPLVRHGEGPLIETEIDLAEMAKYVDNTWHALKIAFANEIGTISKAHGLDGQQVMEILCADTRLNISTAYLSPGMAFGGSCLPKDVRALTYDGRTLDLELPLLNSILSSNERQIDRAFRMVVEPGFRTIGILGLSFKPGTDDLRESPVVELAERLLGKGYNLRIYDGNVSLARLIGANRDYILNQIPHISELLVSTLDEVLDHSQTIIVSHEDPAFRTAVQDLREGQTVVDLCHILDQRSDRGAYNGICW